MKQLPSDVLSGPADDMTIDARFLASRLGVTEDTLKRAMRNGHMAGRLERGDGADAGRLRVTFGNGQWSWSAVMEPDGRCYEVDAPPPTATVGQSGGARPGRRRSKRLRATYAKPAARRLNIIRVLVRSLLIFIAGRNRVVDGGFITRTLKPVVPGITVDQVHRALSILMHEDERHERPFISALVRRRTAVKAWPGFIDTARRCRRWQGGSGVAETTAFWKHELGEAMAFYARR